ncbi:hypothetical protein IWW36_002547 [Coemansia brasiliensis]|uniref:RRM domain-containing protein n=1 Tax=Coemansia brasiliensis TaxID=2650707 RepID=A0A9W8IBR6_9FUNG|nr:hypothetical protein IWW36_002547 [Coemansia brasiliensis]
MQKRKIGKPLSLGLRKPSLDKKQQQQQPAEDSNGRSQLTTVFAADDEAGGLDEEQTEELAAKEAGDKKKRNLDMFMEELKHKHEQQEVRRQTRRLNQGQRTNTSTDSVHQDADVESAAEQSTNLYVSNLHPKVDERELCMAFARFGPIGSVKILWPRTPADYARQQNNGFVCFMKREHAEAALVGMNEAVIQGLALRVVWGKRVPVPKKPFFELDSHGAEKVVLTGLPFNATMGASEKGGGDIPEILVKRPADARSLRLIHWTVEHVIRYGPRFECLLIKRRCKDARFRFLTDWTSADHVYYRWRMYSLLNGDTKWHWHSRMFLMYHPGPVWVPPEIRQGSIIESSDTEENPLRTTLGDRTRERLVHRVQKVQSNERGPIANAMAMAVEHAYAAADVVDIVYESLANAKTPAEQLPKLWLVSDILHNSSTTVPNAWRLRECFESRLEDIFNTLAETHRQIEGRLKAEQHG